MVKNTIVGMVTCAALLSVAADAAAQWTVTNLHPEGPSESVAWAVGGTQQAGHAVVAGVQHASLWSGTLASWTDLHPASASQSSAVALFGTQQAGWAVVNGRYHASLWSGTSGSWVDIHPLGADGSALYSTSGTTQVGYCCEGGVCGASLWFGTPSSRVDLHPSGATESWAFATNGPQQGGYATVGGIQRASLWNGSAESWVDLHPEVVGEGSSRVNAMSTSYQAGYASINGAQHASLWSGTASSWVDLNPADSAVSEVRAATDTFQVGFAYVGGANRASLWTGTAESWVDLHSLLSPEFRFSCAQAVWSDGLNLYVGGFGDTFLSGAQALLWSRPLPCTSPDVVTHPTSTSACLSSPTTFTLSISGTSPNLQWRKNEMNIEGATSASYTIPSVSPADAGSYDCVITNACGTATSNPATLTVRTPQILTQPSSQTVNVDQPVFFALETDPQSPCAAALQYRWQRRNPLVEDDSAPNAWLDLSDGGGLSGTHTPNLAIFRPTPGLATGYRCTISNACGCEADPNGIIHTNTVNFSAACPSDFNADGSVDGDDVIEFFERWDSGC